MYSASTLIYRKLKYFHYSFRIVYFSDIFWKYQYLSYEIEISRNQTEILVLIHYSSFSRRRRSCSRLAIFLESAHAQQVEGNGASFSIEMTPVFALHLLRMRWFQEDCYVTQGQRARRHVVKNMIRSITFNSWQLQVPFMLIEILVVPNCCIFLSFQRFVPSTAFIQRLSFWRQRSTTWLRTTSDRNISAQTDLAQTNQVLHSC